MSPTGLTKIAASVLVLLLVLAGCNGTKQPTSHNAPFVDTNPTQSTVSPSVVEFDLINRSCNLQLEGEDQSIAISLNTLQQFNQEDQHSFRRSVFSVSGSNFSDLGFTQTYYVSNWCRFIAMEPIINYFTGHDIEIAFSSFLMKGPPTRGQLTEDLLKILDERNSDPTGYAGSRFDSVFSTPLQAVSAAIQPALAGTNPLYRNNLRSILMNKWQDRIAMDPEQYQSSDAIAGIFDEILER